MGKIKFKIGDLICWEKLGEHFTDQTRFSYIKIVDIDLNFHYYSLIDEKGMLRHSQRNFEDLEGIVKLTLATPVERLLYGH
jgi:hypothetical protein